jgi:CBS domain-containing protein
MALTCFDTGRATKFERIASCVQAGMMFVNHPVRRSVNAADIMTQPVVFVHADSPLADAVHLMLRHKISGLPVLDEHDKLAGMVTEGDLLRRMETDTEDRPSWMLAFLQPGRMAGNFARAHGRRVSEVMSPDVATVTETTSVRDVVALMQARGIHRVPVMRDGAIVGIVARADIVRALGSILDAHSEAPATAADDTIIRSRLQQGLDEATWTPNGITFTVTDGRVHLYGSFRDDRDRLALRVTAENVPGVTSVTDHLVDANQDPYRYLQPDPPKE